MSGLACSFAHTDNVWVMLVADRQNPGKLVAKDWSGKLCFFHRDCQLPADWKAGQFVSVAIAAEKDKHRVVRFPEHRCDESSFSPAIAALFRGTMVAAFDQHSDNLVLDWLDRRTQEILLSDAFTDALAADTAEQTAALADLDGQS